jgi:DtxR family transcriptional regulator, Mn-dependent transcriptional regulator
MAEETLSASLEDYLEAIYHVVEAKQAARARDIVERLHVHNSSVTQALHALSEKGLINYAPYDLVTLTDSGRLRAGEVVRRHRAVRAFLVDMLGIAPQQAEADACRLEHAISGEVLQRLGDLMAFQAAHPQCAPRWDAVAGGFLAARE